MEKINLPKIDLHGIALREAAAGDFQDITVLVRQAIIASIGGHRDRYVYLEFLSKNKAVAKSEGRYYQYSYTLNKDNLVQLSDKTEVTKDFKAVSKKTSLKESVSDAMAGAFIEALDDKGSKYRIRIIDSGVSLNKVNYPPQVLREAIASFEGSRVFIKSDEDHIKGKGKSFANLIGKLSNVKFVEAKGTKPAGLEGDFTVLSGDTAIKLKEAVEKNMTDIFGFSIDADGTMKKPKRGDKFREATKITKVNSVDLIIEPGAGGQVIKLLEAVASDKSIIDLQETEDTMLKEKMIEAIKKANANKLPAGLDVDNLDDIEVAYREAIGAGSGGSPASTASEEAPATGVTQAQLDEHTRMIEARADMRVQIGNSDLPEPAKTKVLGQFREAKSFDAKDVTAAITAEKDYLAKFTESGKVKGTGDNDFDDVNAGYREAKPTNAMNMLDAFWDRDDRSVVSLKECYQSITGDKKVTGRFENANVSKLREAIGDSHGSHFREAISSDTWALMLGDSIHRSMIRDWNSPSDRYDIYKLLVDVVPLDDFREKTLVKFAGYGDIPKVAERGDYLPLSTPADREEKYKPEKRGGLESISLETLKNNDMGAVQRIPGKLSQAAKRTLAKFVLNFLRDNPNMSNGLPLFSVANGNLGTDAIGKDSVDAQRLRMMDQAEDLDGDPNGPDMAHLFVNKTQQRDASDLFRRGAENDKDFVASLDYNIVPVWYWTDTNDFCGVADIRDIPLIELGFLDGNEEPSIFIQDSPTIGSMFSNDVLTWKLQHIYGAGLTGFEGLQKNVVV